MGSGAVGSLLVLGLLLQSTVLHRLSIAGVRPDLVLVLIILLGLVQGPRYGAAVGFAGGLLQDLLSGQLIGMNALAKMAVGYSIGLMEEKVFKENIITPLAAVLAGTLLHGLLVGVMLILGGKLSFLPMVLRMLLPGAAYNCLISLLFTGKFKQQAGVLRLTRSL